MMWYVRSPVALVLTCILTIVLLESYASNWDAALSAFRDPTFLNTLLNLIGHAVEAELLFATIVKLTHCLYGQQYQCDRAFSCAGISFSRFIVRGNHNRICCTLRPVRASHKSGEISRPHGHHSSHSIRDVYWQSEALSHSI